MKLYYYAEGEKQLGPYTVEQLGEKKININTLIWAEGMENWQSAKDIPEVYMQLLAKSKPPPIPKRTVHEPIKTEIEGSLTITTDKTKSTFFEMIMRDKTHLIFIITWFVANLFALLTSYSQIRIFNDDGLPNVNKFWPFVEFVSKNEINYIFYGRETYFNGIFVNYDWTEFVFYVGIVIFIYTIVAVLNNNNSVK
jgi:hypothetical protein